MEGRPRSQPDDLINFRQLRSNALQAAELDIYDGDDIRSVFFLFCFCFLVCLGAWFLMLGSVGQSCLIKVKICIRDIPK